MSVVISLKTLHAVLMLLKSIRQVARDVRAQTQAEKKLALLLKHQGYGETRQMAEAKHTTITYREGELSPEERGPDYYDAVYSEGPYDTDRYKPVYECVLGMLTVPETGQTKKVNGERLALLELGCGTGAFASMALIKNIHYRGFDFSREAIRQCPRHVQPFVAKKNIYGVHCWRQTHNVVVAIETIEHVDDIAITKKIAPGKVVIYTLPNFTDAAHLRTYPEPEFIKERFKSLIKWHEIVTIDMPEDKKIYVCRGKKL
jgi:2-polyprenyl-3-methyl-5-hydroxy-6-metoxy-1,4-benzoquinol methylase